MESICNISHHLIDGEPVSHYHLVDLDDSANQQCYLKVDVNSPLDNSTDYMYTPAQSIFSGLGATFLSIFGFSLNLLFIWALVKDTKLRQEYLTPPILSLATTDLLYSMITLPITATRYFVKYVFISVLFTTLHSFYDIKAIHNAVTYS